MLVGIVAVDCVAFVAFVAVATVAGVAAGIVAGIADSGIGGAVTLLSTFCAIGAKLLMLALSLLGVPTTLMISL